MPSLPMTGAGPSAAGFSPLSIANLQLWLDASVITSIADNSDLATWSDLSGNARHATQSTAADKPHFQVAYQNGLGAVEFDGANHWMDLDLSSAIALADHTFIIACETQDTAGNNDQRFLDVGLGADEFVISSVTATTGRLGWYDGAWESTVAATDGVQVLTYQLDDAGAEIFRDGASIGSGLGLIAHELGDNASIGANPSGSYQFDGHIFEMLLYSPILSDANRAIVEAYLIAKWGI